MYVYDRNSGHEANATASTDKANKVAEQNKDEAKAKAVAAAAPRPTGDAASPDTMAVLPVRVMTVRYLAGYQTEERYIGRIYSRRTSDLGFERAGRIATIPVDEGDVVKAGQSLAKLTTDILRAEKKTLMAKMTFTRADHQVASEKLVLARATHKRRSQLVKEHNVSRQRFDEAAYDAKSAEANLAAAAARISEMKANIEQLDLEIRLSTIRAPFDGQIVARFADEGTTLAVGTPVMRVIEHQALEVHAGVPARLARRLEIGKRYEIEIGARTLTAPLKAVLDEMDADTRSVPTVFRLEDPEDGWVGQIVRLIIKHKVPARGFWIPITGLVEGRRGLWNAYALETSTARPDMFKLSRRELKLIYNDATRAYVTGTLSDDERVVTTGLQRLVPDQLVRLP